MTTPALAPDRLSRLHDVLARHVERGAAPGLVSVVARGGETRVDAIGAMAVDGPSMPEDAIFRISSMTKPVVAVAALLLVEECVLRLDDPVDRFLPELADRRVVRRIDGPVEDTVPARRPITLRDLLTFRMGTGVHLGPCPVADAAAPLELFVGPPRPALPPEPDEWMRRFATLPLMAQPGERWLYNTGSDVLGVLIARASGSALPDVLRERIFEPLGMVDTGFAVPPAAADRLVGAYTPDPATGALHPYPAAAQWLTAPAFPSGVGGLVSTAADYLAFARMLHRGGAPVLSRPSVRAMTTDQLTPEQKAPGGLFADDFDGRGWGFGVSVVTRHDTPAAPVGQYGWDGGLGTVWRNDPAEDMITVLLTNVAWTSPRPPVLARDFLTGAYAAVAG
ncbi:serine hydrolase domain-containing protein [Pseudonocardia humida]|uniref:serine hydrolase domain-containing protein n=1 Tax=Pseudonocardia humida TaxID=2800819 RepID=UPI00207D624A|nr:serine hydrolase domain-containing protein [Pseudonocardia humida]